MSWSEDSPKSLRSRVAQVEEVYKHLVVSLKGKVHSLEEELVGVKDQMVDLHETVQRQTGSESLLQAKQAPGQPDLNRTVLLRMRSFFNQCEAFNPVPSPEVVGATVVQAESSDSLFSNSREDSPETPSERPPLVNSDFLKKLSSILLKGPITSISDPNAATDPQHLPANVPLYSPAYNPHPRPTPCPASTSSTRPPPRPPPPPPPPPNFSRLLLPSPPGTSFARPYRASRLPSFARHASASATPIPAAVLDCFKRYCLVTQGSGTGGLHFLNDDTHIHLKTRRQDRVYQFNKVFRIHKDANTMPETLKNDIYKLVRGKEVCVVAFGHSYTGKTRLVLGGRRKNRTAGLLGKAAKKIIKACQNHKNTVLKISACEIFSGETRDLLREESTKGQTDNSWGSRPATWIDLTSTADVHLIKRIIWARRKTRVESWPNSSASHLLLTLTVVQTGDVVGRMVMVDLAGFRTHATKTRSEADRYINFSLKDLVFALSGMNYDRTSLLVQMLEDYLLGPRTSVYVFCCLGRWEGQQHANCLALHYLGN